MSGLRAFAVVDLGFGDAGKGLCTDFLARRTGAGVIVRFNGGAQAGHNVVTADGRHHTFAQFGAGTFVPGVRTFLSRHMVVHPTALIEEARVLRSKQVDDAIERVAISENALLVTPFHQAANRLRELARGAARHGSCGAGVGEAVSDALRHPHDAVRAVDLRDSTVLAEKLRTVRQRLHVEVDGLHVPTSKAAAREREFFEADGVIPTWIDRCQPLIPRVVPDVELASWLSTCDAVIFEGAQGLLLDETFGFHPHTTWSRCTAEGARELLREAAPATQLRVIGILRAHAVRHGPGPLPTEDAALATIMREHNVTNEWQGPVRRGWFDGVLARHAIALTPKLDTLMITHVDALAAREEWSLCNAYETKEPIDAESATLDRDGLATDIVPREDPTLERQERLGRWMLRCRPRLVSVPADEPSHLTRLEECLKRRIDLVSRGPSPGDVELRTGALTDAAPE